MKVKFKYIIHGEFSIPTKNYLSAVEMVDKILIGGNLELINQGKYYTSFEVLPREKTVGGMRC